MPQVAVSLGVSVVFSLAARGFRDDPNGADRDERRGSARMVRGSVEPQNVVYGRARVSGPLVFAETTGPDNTFLHVVVPLARGPVEAIETVFLNDEAIAIPGGLSGAGTVTSGRFADLTRIKVHLGAEDQAANVNLVQEVPAWSANHRLRGTAYVYVRLQYDPQAFPTGIPNVSAVVKGRGVWDPRLHPGNPAAKSFSANPALCLLDYLMADFGFGVGAAEIHEPSWNAAAGTCDNSVTTADGRSILRYTCNGTFRLNRAPMEIKDDLLSAMAGALVYQGGQFRAYAAAATVATATLSERDLRGPVDVDTRPGRGALFNAVKGTFVDPQTHLLTNFPEVTSALYESEDNGERLGEEIRLPFTNDPNTAQRIAAIILNRHRQGMKVVFPAKLTAFDIAAWDVVRVSIARLGWTDKEFRVLEWALSPDGGVDLVLQEEAASIYAFDPATDEILIDPAPDTNLPSAFFVPQPGVPTVTESLYQTRDGAGVRARVTLAWSIGNPAFADEYQVEYRRSADAGWTVAGRTKDRTLEIRDVAPGRYDFRVKAINGLRVSSPYATLSNRSIQGLAAAPADIAGLTLASLGGTAVLRWDRHPDLDVRMGGRVEFRHSRLQAGATWGASVSIGNAVTGDQTVAILPLKPGSYLAKAVDSSGQKSANAAVVRTAGAQALAFANVGSVSEHAAFPGVHDNTVASGGTLKLDSGGAVDDIGGSPAPQGFPDLWDDVANLDALGGVLASGAYDFAGGIDLGSKKKVRLRSVVGAMVVAAFDLIDARTNPVDGWEDWDGDVGGSPSAESAGVEADAQVWYRSTDDDPSGSPAAAWSDWNRLDAAEDEARAFDFQLRLTSSDPAFNIEVRELTVQADEVV